MMFKLKRIFKPYFVLFFYTNVKNIVIILEFMTRTLKFIISGVFYDHQTSENRKLKMDRVASDRIILYIRKHFYSEQSSPVEFLE